MFSSNAKNAIRSSSKRIALLATLAIGTSLTPVGIALSTSAQAQTVASLGADQQQQILATYGDCLKRNPSLWNATYDELVRACTPAPAPAPLAASAPSYAPAPIQQAYYPAAPRLSSFTTLPRPATGSGIRIVINNTNTNTNTNGPKTGPIGPIGPVGTKPGPVGPVGPILINNTNTNTNNNGPKQGPVVTTKPNGPLGPVTGPKPNGPTGGIVINNTNTNTNNNFNRSPLRLQSLGTNVANRFPTRSTLPATSFNRFAHNTSTQSHFNRSPMQFQQRAAVQRQTFAPRQQMAQRASFSRPSAGHVSRRR